MNAPRPKPFRLQIPDAAIADLRERLARTRTVMQKGGHFAALEQPQALAHDIKAFFASL